MAEEKEYCNCPDWSPCACSSMTTDPHCMYCCRSLTPEQLAKIEQEGEMWWTEYDASEGQ